jgi:hypothetical protein
MVVRGLYRNMGGVGRSGQVAALSFKEGKEAYGKAR